MSAFDALDEETRASAWSLYEQASDREVRRVPSKKSQLLPQTCLHDQHTLVNRSQLLPQLCLQDQQPDSRLIEGAKSTAVFRRMSDDDLRDEVTLLRLIEKDEHAFMLVPEELRASRDFVVKAVGRNVEVFAYLAPKFRSDAEIALAAVSLNGFLLLHASSQRCDDPAVIKAAVTQAGLSFQFASRCLRADERLCILAVCSDPKAFKYCLEPARSKPDIVYAALEKDWTLLKYAPVELWQDEDFVTRIMGRESGCFDFGVRENMFSRLPQAMITDKQFLIRCLIGHPAGILGHLPQSMRNSFEVVQAALSYNAADMQYVPRLLKTDPKIQETVATYRRRMSNAYLTGCTDTTDTRA